MALPILISRYNRTSYNLEESEKDPKSEADIMKEVLGPGGSHATFGHETVQCISQYLSIFHTRIKFNEKATLTEYIAPEYREESFIERPLEIGTAMYGARRRILNVNFGLLFPIDNEVQAYVMSRIRAQPDMQVCEIGCASGEMGILCVYAGAQVIFNDIEPREIALLRTNLKSLPKFLQKKCTVVASSCLDLLTHRPNLKKRVDIVLCRNLLHFLSAFDQVKLLAIARDMLKPGGQAVFITNSIYREGNNLPKDSLEESERAPSSFCSQNCILESPSLGGNSVVLYRTLSYCSEEMFSLHEYREHYIYSKLYKEDKWRPCSTTIKHTDVPKVLLKTVPETMRDPEVNSFLKQFPTGRLKATSSYTRFYNVNNLTRLFRENGFDVLCTFIVNGLGHLVLDHSKRFEQGQQVGIIATLSNEK